MKQKGKLQRSLEQHFVRFAWSGPIDSRNGPMREARRSGLGSSDARDIRRHRRAAVHQLAPREYRVFRGENAFGWSEVSEHSTGRALSRTQFQLPRKVDLLDPGCEKVLRFLQKQPDE